MDLSFRSVTVVVPSRYMNGQDNSSRTQSSTTMTRTSTGMRWNTARRRDRGHSKGYLAVVSFHLKRRSTFCTIWQCQRETIASSSKCSTYSKTIQNYVRLFSSTKLSWRLLRTWANLRLSRCWAYSRLPRLRCMKVRRRTRRLSSCNAPKVLLAPQERRRMYETRRFKLSGPMMETLPW